MNPLWDAGASLLPGRNESRLLVVMIDESQAHTKILAIETDSEKADANALKPFLKAEAASVWELWQAGIVREAYFRQDRPEAVLILECADAAEADEVLRFLPLVKEGLIAFQLIALRPYSGFARLFSI